VARLALLPTVLVQERPTFRQLRLLAWLRRPIGLPGHPAINWADAWWTAAELVDLAGVHDSRRQCLGDLHQLRRLGLVERLGNRWALTSAGR
jgi:hypothetical protein